MITIKAAIAESKGVPFEIAELELDEPRPDEVLVRMVACGICQTDSHAWHQHLPVPLPAVLGHEGAGVVESIGSTVTSVAPGDHVVLSYQACGRCPQCLSGHSPYCDRAGEANFGGARLDGTNGVHRHRGAAIAGDVHGHFFGQSSFATYALTTERNTVKVPDGIPLEILAPLGCGLQTGAGAVLNTFRMSPRESIAVFGTGAVGLAAVMAARVAAALLAEGGSGKRVIELAGPREYSPRDVAAALARVVGKPIAVQEAPEDAMEPALAAAGMNAEWTRLFKELTHGLNTGIVVWEGGHPLWRGETDIQTVLSALLGK
jgi:D-arabinose 1-dehydrogenase-like Zn-dependent alcohol dehydrogenase